MRSSSGQHFIALDHVRALAAFMVFAWHFLHGGRGYPIAFGHAPVLIPAALLDQGHLGVALFMTLSGYLFAKLLNGQRVAYAAFFWNRVLRLLPLLLLVVLAYDVVGYIYHGGHAKLLSYVRFYILQLAEGAIFPTLPYGAWSITVEFHFYLLLPALLWMTRRSKWLPFSIIVGSVALRAVIHFQHYDVSYLAYWTIIGRIDQFVFGVLAFQFRDMLAGRHARAIVALTAFSAFYWCIDARGGAFSAPAALWIILPTIDGLAFAAAIAWYDNSFKQRLSPLSRFVGHMGEYSYSIYLLHPFVVFRAAAFVDAHVIRLSNFYVACTFALICYLMMAPIGYLSYRFIESPFLRLRRPYLLRSDNLSRATAVSEQVA